MKKLYAFSLALGISCIAAHGQPTDCSFYDSQKGPYLWNSKGTAEHLVGSHNWSNVLGGSCTYGGTAQSNTWIQCSAHAVASSSSYSNENGTLTWLHWHSVNQKDAQGVADSSGGIAATADAEGAAAAVTCNVFPCGTPGISLSGAGKGGGFNVSYSPVNPLWQDSRHYPNACGGEVLQPLPSICPNPDPPSPPYNDGSGGYYWYWDTNACQWENNGSSPVVFDTTNTGFKFTDPTKGNYVTFDIRGDGNPKKLSWTEVGSGNAWLALDRDGDGIIKDGTELFGNFTPHSDGGVVNHHNPNGFLALAWYDQDEQGGDGNLILDKRDAIWPKLRLWIDEHCYKAPDVPCQSLPKELHTLESKGVTSISLVWDAKYTFDAIGNQFKFFTVVNPEAATREKDEHGNSCCDLHQKSKDARLAYDVWLKTIN